MYGILELGFFKTFRGVKQLLGIGVIVTTSSDDIRCGALQVQYVISPFQKLRNG